MVDSGIVGLNTIGGQLSGPHINNTYLRHQTDASSKYYDSITPGAVTFVGVSYLLPA